MAHPRRRRDSPHWRGQGNKTLVSPWRQHPRYFIFTCLFFLVISLLKRQLYRLHGNELGWKTGMWVIDISVLNLRLTWLSRVVVREGKRDLYIYTSSVRYLIRLHICLKEFVTFCWLSDHSSTVVMHFTWLDTCTFVYSLEKINHRLGWKARTNKYKLMTENEHQGISWIVCISASIYSLPSKS